MSSAAPLVRVTEGGVVVESARNTVDEWATIPSMDVRPIPRSGCIPSGHLGTLGVWFQVLEDLGEPGELYTWGAPYPL